MANQNQTDPSPAQPQRMGNQTQNKRNNAFDAEMNPGARDSKQKPNDVPPTVYGDSQGVGQEENEESSRFTEGDLDQSETYKADQGLGNDQINRPRSPETEWSKELSKGY